MIVSLVVITLTTLYAAFIGWCSYHWAKTKAVSSGDNFRADVRIAVIIPARNESVRLPLILKALKDQEYPAEFFEIIVVDDHSDDQSYETAARFFNDEKMKNGICLRSTGQMKKDAISFAVGQTNAELIITTDADADMGRKWITSIALEYSRNKESLICGPVRLISGDTIFGRLQSAEFAGLVGISAASIHAGRPMMCNGANLAFPKTVFMEVNGYENSTSASGDDTQLLRKVNRLHPGKIVFLKDEMAIVSTSSMQKKSEWWSQRKRWASKIPFTLSFFTVSIAALAWLVHAALLFQLLLSVISGNFLVLILLLLIKTAPEIIFLKQTGSFLNLKFPAWLIVLVQPFYSLYIFLIGILLPFGTYQWKGRKLK